MNIQSVLAGRLCGNGHNALQKFSAAMDLPSPVAPPPPPPQISRSMRYLFPISFYQRKPTQRNPN